MNDATSNVTAAPQAEIPVCETQSWDALMETHAGVPLWPLSTAEEGKSLRALAGLFGGAVKPSEGRPAAAPSGEGVVAYLSDACEPHARLYAHLTGRSHAPVADVEELADLENFVAVVATFDSLTPRLLDVLDRITRRGKAPGIICADDERGLRKQVLLRSAALSYLFRARAGRPNSGVGRLISTREKQRFCVTTSVV